MTAVNSLGSYTKNAVGPTRYSIHPVISFQLKSQPRYVPPNLYYRLSYSFFFAIPKAWTFLREFVLGNNQTGLVTDASIPAVGGEDPQYAVNTLAEGPEVYRGSYTTTSTYYFPSATVARWDKYVQNSLTSNASRSFAQADGAGKIASGVVLNALFSALVSFVFAFVWLF